MADAWFKPTAARPASAGFTQTVWSLVNKTSEHITGRACTFGGWQTVCTCGIERCWLCNVVLLCRLLGHNCTISWSSLAASMCVFAVIKFVYTLFFEGFRDFQMTGTDVGKA